MTGTPDRPSAGSPNSDSFASRSRPGVLVCGSKGGSGKTVVTLGLIGALRKAGLAVGSFKKGPDYIDAAWMELATGRDCYNLDSFLMDESVVLRSFFEHHVDAEAVIVEGNRGLHDGMDSTGTHSSAELSKRLGLPLILVVDCTKMTRTAAAFVMGSQAMDPEVNIAGVILNRVAGARHESVARDAVERYTGIPVLGAVPKLNSLTFWERHLGLMPVAEHPDAGKVVEDITRAIEENVNIDRLFEIATTARSIAPEATDSPKRSEYRPEDLVEVERPLRIGILRDAAFNFYYPENLKAVEELGGEWVSINALEEKELPKLDALYIGGGFPETQAERLAANESFRKSLRAAIENGMPVYAECGGLTFLGQAIETGGQTFPMTGVFPVCFEIAKKPQGHGYTIVEVDQPNPFYPAGMVFRGHEFRYSRVKSGDLDRLQTVLRMNRGAGFADGRDGLVYKNVLALFSHVHAWGNLSWAKGLMRAAQRYRQTSSSRQLNEAELTI